MMLVEERRKKLLELLKKERYVQLFALAEALNVSQSTVRRDVDTWVREGLLRRTYGGVVLNDGRDSKTPEDVAVSDAEEVEIHELIAENPLMSAFHLPGMPPSGVKVGMKLLRAVHWFEKCAIAERAASMIQDGDTVLIDGGSTAYLVAQKLVSKQLTLITNSLPVANLFTADPTTELILIGGNVCPRTGVVRGPYADNMLKQMCVKRAIISAAGIDQDGFYNNNLLLAETQRTIHTIAHELIVVADSSKFGHKSLAHICSLEQVTHLVTDDGVSDEWEQIIQNANVALHIVKPGLK